MRPSAAVTPGVNTQPGDEFLIDLRRGCVMPPTTLEKRKV